MLPNSNPADFDTSAARTGHAIGHLLTVLQEHVLADDLRHKEPLRQLTHNVLGAAGWGGGWGVLEAVKQGMHKTGNIISCGDKRPSCWAAK